MENLNPPALHGEVVAGRASTLRYELRTLSTNLKKHTFDLAELLYEASNAGYTREWGFRSLGEFAEQELGIRERKSQYLVRIVEVCKAVGLTRAQYELAGVSKLREITTLDPEGFYFNEFTKENESLTKHILALIDCAPGMSATRVQEEVLSLKGMTGGNKPVVRSFSCPQDAWENVIKKALERVRMRLGSAGRDEDGKAKEYSDGVCFEAICADFLAGDEVQETETIPMEEI